MSNQTTNTGAANNTNNQNKGDVNMNNSLGKVFYTTFDKVGGVINQDFLSVSLNTPWYAWWPLCREIAPKVSIKTKAGEAEYNAQLNNVDIDMLIEKIQGKVLVFWANQKDVIDMVSGFLAHHNYELLPFKDKMAKSISVEKVCNPNGWTNYKIRGMYNGVSIFAVASTNPENTNTSISYYSVNGHVYIHTKNDVKMEDKVLFAKTASMIRNFIKYAPTYTVSEEESKLGASAETSAQTTNA